MTFTPLTLDLNEYGILSGQLYQPEVHSVGQLEQSANFRKDARLVIPVSYTHLRAHET